MATASMMPARAGRVGKSPVFEVRARQYLEAAACAAAGWYDADGGWRLASKPPEDRERLWVSFALYACGRERLADAVCRRTDTPLYGRVRFNIFDTNIAVALLVEHRTRMAGDVRRKLTALARDGFSFRPGNRQPDYQFHGYNDNMPAKATMGLVLGGELLGHRAALEYGLWDLRQLRAQLVRGGVNSEYNSPTYSPLTLHAMGAIAARARHPEARRIAREIEARLWVDVASRFHPALGTVVGPYARAYTVDTLAHVSILSSLLWFVLDRDLPVSPMMFFDPPEGLVVHHHGDYPFNIAQMCWLAGGHYHLPAAARRLFAHKRLPFRSVATCETGDAGPDFPARNCRLETYLQPDYGLGTSLGALLGGEQSLHYAVVYRRRASVTSFRDVGTVFHKLFVDADVPGTIVQAQSAVPAGLEQRRASRPRVVRYANRGESDYVASRAHTLVLQDGPTALVLDHPHLSLGGAPDTGEGVRPIRRLSDLVVFPRHSGECDELLVGGRRRRAWSGAVPDGAWIACRRGRLLMAIRPLAFTREFGKPRVTLEQVNRYDVLRMALYEGPPRRFTRTELRHVFGGFLAEHAGVDEFPSLAAFARACARTRLTDYFWSTRRVLCHRPASRWRPALDLEVSWSSAAGTTRVATINGKPVSWPVVAIDGVQARRLPFLGRPPAPVEPFFPWKDLRVAWGDWPYAINARDTTGGRLTKGN